MQQRYATHPDQIPAMDTTTLRGHYLVPDVFTPGQITLTYTHHDRIVLGGAAPTTGPLTLTPPPQLRAEYFLEFREIGIVNVGAPGSVTVDGDRHDLDRGACLYVGRGCRDVVFDGDGAQFYLFSAPAHTAYPTVLVPPGQATASSWATSPPPTGAP